MPEGVESDPAHAPPPVAPVAHPGAESGVDGSGFEYPGHQVRGVDSVSVPGGEHEVVVSGLRVLAEQPQGAAEAVGEAELSAPVLRLGWGDGVPVEAPPYLHGADAEVYVLPSQLYRLTDPKT